MNSHCSGNRQTCGQMCLMCWPVVLRESQHVTCDKRIHRDKRGSRTFILGSSNFAASASPPEPTASPESLFQQVSRTQWLRGALNSGSSAFPLLRNIDANEAFCCWCAARKRRPAESLEATHSSEAFWCTQWGGSGGGGGKDASLRAVH